MRKLLKWLVIIATVAAGIALSMYLVRSGGTMLADGVTSSPADGGRVEAGITRLFLGGGVMGIGFGFLIVFLVAKLRQPLK